MPKIDLKLINKDLRHKTDKKFYGLLRGNHNIPYGEFSKYSHISGIYGIKCIKTNKIYIGSTINIQLRVLKHFNELFHNRHANKKLQQDFNLYGYDFFTLIVYEIADKNDLLIKEKDLQIKIGIDNLYNERISGFYVDPEYRKKLSNASKATHKTQKYRDKMRKLKTNKIGQFDIFTNKLLKIWESAVILCEEYGYTRSVILSCCNGNKPKAYGFKWKYIDDNGNIILDGYAKGRKK